MSAIITRISYLVFSHNLVNIAKYRLHIVCTFQQIIAQGCSGPLQSVRGARNVICFLKAMTNSKCIFWSIPGLRFASLFLICFVFFFFFRTFPYANCHLHEAVCTLCVTLLSHALAALGRVVGFAWLEGVAPGTRHLPQSLRLDWAMVPGCTLYSTVGISKVVLWDFRGSWGGWLSWWWWLV